MHACTGEIVHPASIMHERYYELVINTIGTNSTTTSTTEPVVLSNYDIYCSIDIVI